MSKFGKRLIKAAKGARAIARAEAKPGSYRVHVPADVDVRGIRSRLGLSQAAFASRFGIPQGTIRDWEQGRRRPEGPARVLTPSPDASELRAEHHLHVPPGRRVCRPNPQRREPNGNAGHAVNPVRI